MQDVILPEEAHRIGEARMSFSGLLLTDRQFKDFIALTGIIKGRIEENGSFIEPLNESASFMARSERMGVVKADTTIRNLFQSRYDMTMNTMRDGLLKREKALFDRKVNPAEQERQMAYQAAIEAGGHVQHGTKMTFHRALAHEAARLSHDLGITHVGAKKLMEESFKDFEGGALRAWGKELDEKFYRPQIEAEKRQRESKKSPSRNPQPSYS
ncbi:MAG: hypothetical protein ACE37E_11235 [Hyphomicrobiales bacterium]